MKSKTSAFTFIWTEAPTTITSIMDSATRHLCTTETAIFVLESTPCSERTTPIRCRHRKAVRDLRERYAEVLGDETHTGNKQWLVKRIACAIRLRWIQNSKSGIWV